MGGSEKKKNEAFGWVCLALLSLQCGLQPVLTKHFIDQKVVSNTSIVVIVEVAKFVLSSAMLILTGELVPVVRQWSFLSSLSGAGLPAAIYSVQNMLIWMAYDNLDGLTFNLVNQSKTLFTAVFVYVLLGKAQTRMQIVGLFLLFVAAVVLCWPTQEDLQGSKKANSFRLGIVPVLAASALSGLASGLSELTLVAKTKNSYMFTMELCIFSTAVVLITRCATGEIVADLEDPFKGWSALGIIPVASQASGGLLVGQVITHLGGVRKGFGMIFGILIAGFVQSIELSVLPEVRLWVGMILVISGTYIHNTFALGAKPVPPTREQTQPPRRQSARTQPKRNAPKLD